MSQGYNHQNTLSRWNSAPLRPIKAVIISIVIHIILGSFLYLKKPQELPKRPAPIKVTIKTIEKAKPLVKEIAEVPIKPDPPPPPKPPPKAKAAANQKPQELSSKPAKPVLGLNPKALSPTADGIAVPAGNTLMTGDKGERPKAETIKPLTHEDLSAEAVLLASTIIIPKYTDDAIDANLEMPVTVEVFVNSQGVVTKAELRKKVGYGMDNRILETARQARFTARKDKFGNSVEGWTEIKFRLEIPN